MTAKTATTSHWRLVLLKGHANAAATTNPRVRLKRDVALPSHV
jgi:hypothetical protein